MNKNDYRLILYADDILCIERISDSLDVHVSATNIIADWCSCKDLLLNNEKTLQLFIRRARNFVIPDEYENIVICDTVKVPTPI